MADKNYEHMGDDDYKDDVDKIAYVPGSSNAQDIGDAMRLFGVGAPDLGERDTRADIPDSIADTFVRGMQDLNAVMGGHTNGDSVKNMIGAVLVASLHAAEKSYENSADYHLEELNEETDGLSDADLEQEVVGNKYETAWNKFFNAENARQQYENIRTPVAGAYRQVFDTNWTGHHDTLIDHTKNTVYFTKDNIKGYINNSVRPVIVFASNKNAQQQNLKKIVPVLDGRLAKNPNMILVTFGGKDEANQIAVQWANNNGVKLDNHEVNWNKKNDGFKRNKRIVNTYGNRIKGVITCGNSGIIGNLINRTSERNIKRVDLDYNYKKSVRPVKPELVQTQPSQLNTPAQKAEIVNADIKTVGHHMYSLIRQQGITETKYAEGCQNIAHVHNQNNKAHVFTLSSAQMEKVQTGTLGENSALSKLHVDMTYNGTVSSVLPDDKAVLDTTHIVTVTTDMNALMQDKEQFMATIQGLPLQNANMDKMYVGLPMDKDTGGQHFVKLSELKDLAGISEIKYTGNQFTINQYYDDRTVMLDADKHPQAPSIHTIMGDDQNMQTVSAYTQDLVQQGTVSFDAVSFIRKDTTHMVTDMHNGLNGQQYVTPHYDLSDAVKQVFENKHAQQEMAIHMDKSTPETANINTPDTANTTSLDNINQEPSIQPPEKSKDIDMEI